MATEFEAIYENGVLKPSQPLPFQEHEFIQGMIQEKQRNTIGTSAAVVSATESAPHVPAEWVDEFEQLIAEGRRSPTHPLLFWNEPVSQEIR